MCISLHDGREDEGGATDSNRPVMTTSDIPTNSHHKEIRMLRTEQTCLDTPCMCRHDVCGGSSSPACGQREDRHGLRCQTFGNCFPAPRRTCPNKASRQVRSCARAVRWSGWWSVKRGGGGGSSKMTIVCASKSALYQSHPVLRSCQYISLQKKSRTSWGKRKPHI